MYEFFTTCSWQLLSFFFTSEPFCSFSRSYKKMMINRHCCSGLKVLSVRSFALFLGPLIMSAFKYKKKVNKSFHIQCKENKQNKTKCVSAYSILIKLYKLNTLLTPTPGAVCYLIIKVEKVKIIVSQENDRKIILSWLILLKANEFSVTPFYCI